VLFRSENVPIWSRVAYEVVKIDDNADAGKLYYIAGSDKPYIRSQVLLVK
jgi:hypothetical protein